MKINMGNVPATSHGLLKVVIPENKMKAWVVVRSTRGAGAVTPEDVLQPLKHEGVAITPAVRSRAEELVRLMTTGAPVPERFLIAEGQLPQDGSSEQFNWDERYQKQITSWQEDEPIDFYSITSIITVEEGSVIGTLLPGSAPEDGFDVTGARLPAKESKQLELDGTLERTSHDPPRIIARASGRVVEDFGSMRIDEVLCIKGDVGFETGNIESRIDIAIDGLIPDRFEVESQQSITVGKSIEAARVDAKRDIIVNQGILGRKSGLVTAGGDIIAKYASDANIVTKGDVRIAKQVMNSQLYVGGRLDAGRASVVGGATHVCLDAEVGNLGSGGGTPTRIVVGVLPDTLRDIAVLDARMREEGRSLSTDDRDEMKRRREGLVKRVYTGRTPRVIVTGTIYHKSTVQIGQREAYFRHDLKGPISIEERDVEGRMELVAVNPGSGSVSVLPSQKRNAEFVAEQCEIESAPVEE